MPENIPRQSTTDFLLDTVRSFFERIQKVEATNEVLKRAIAEVLLRERGEEMKAAFLEELARSESALLALHREELEQSMRTLRSILTYGASQPRA